MILMLFLGNIEEQIYWMYGLYVLNREVVIGLIEQPYNPEIALLGIYLGDMKILVIYPGDVKI